MNYQETIDWLFSQTAVFQRDGASAYKPGLDTIRSLCSRLGDPQQKLRCIHIAGTNGKGSTASTLAAILQSAGLKTALYTSPHLVDFRERMRINGMMIPAERVVRFIDNYRQTPLEPAPSFFELTTAMAFEWFADETVDIAVIETGLGGRLDSTNIITPVLSIITNISLDHTALLGNSVEAIAAEKAGIIKPGVPVIVGEAESESVRRVFESTAERLGSQILFAEAIEAEKQPDGTWFYPSLGARGSLAGDFQQKNASTVAAALQFLPEVGAEAVARGFEHVEELTGLRGRLEVWQTEPQRIVYDTGHNPGAWKWLGAETARFNTLVIGFAADKDVDKILDFLPRGKRYVFTRPACNRGLDAEILRQKAAAAGIDGEAIDSVAAAVARAREITPSGGSIFIGGSNFVIADFLQSSLPQSLMEADK